MLSRSASAERGKVRGAAHASEATYVFDSWDKAYPQVNLADDDKAATRKSIEDFVRSLANER